MKTIDLKTAIYNKIQAVVNNTYEQGHVDKDTTYPYAVYGLGTSIEGQVDSPESIQYSLEIDLYDYRVDKDTSVIECLADSVDGELNRQHHIDSDFYFQCIRESRTSNYPVPDDYTFRRNLRYTLKVFRRSGS